MSEALAVQNNSLIPVGEARQMLARCERLDEAKEWRTRAAAVQKYLGETTEDAMNAAEIRLRAERRLGELLDPEREKRGRVKWKVSTLKESGISKDQSADWQAAARIPEPQFEAYITERRAVRRSITLGGLLRLLPVEAEAANGDAKTTPPAEACDTESGTCGPPTARDKGAHIAGLVEALGQSMILFNACKSYDVNALIEKGTKRSVKVLLRNINPLIAWLESLRDASRRRAK